jgi:methionyl-tRNA synthetase
MIAKNCEGKVPVPGEFSEADRAILDQADAALHTARKAMDDQALHLALGAIFAVVAEANRYFAGQEPWALRKTDAARMGTVLYVTAEVIRRVGIMVQPFIPQSAEKLLDILAIPVDKRQFSDVTASQLVGGSDLPAPQPIFPRYVETEEKN